jgi:uncharacterized membrane protein
MAAAGTDHALERMVFFSDAVFAIAITLLVIELHPPHFPRGTADIVHVAALADLIPAFVGYLISFWVIGMFWMGHHRAFAFAAHYSPRILMWNMALLSVIAFMPFATAYLSANFLQRVPTVLYCLGMLAAGLLNLKVNRTATSPPMVDEAAPAEAVAYVRRRGTAVVLGSATSVLFAILVPVFGQVGLVSIPLWLALLNRLARRGASALT